MESNEIINRIKLMMNYDSKKTLTENKSFLKEESYSEIAQKFRDGQGSVFGTDEGDLEYGARMVQRTITSWPEFIKLDDEIKKSNGGKNLQDLLNSELRTDDIETVKVIVDLLNKTAGLSADYKEYTAKDGRKYFKENSITIIQKSGGENTSSKDKAGIKGNAGINWTTAPTIEDAKSASSNNKYIKYGMSGNSVVEIQTKLNEKGGYNLETKTKKFGTNTKNALIDFQKNNNITPAQGVFGPKTWRVLFAPQPNANVETSNQQKQEKPILQNPMNTTKGFSDYELNNTSQPTT
jgi:hypothetical protein